MVDENLFVDKEEVRDWFNWRRISYYYEEEKGVLFLHFCSTPCPVLHGFSGPGSSFDAAVEEIECEDIKGLLFMFSVSFSLFLLPFLFLFLFPLVLVN